MPNGVGSGSPPAKALPPGHRVAGDAVADRRELGALRDQFGIERCALGRLFWLDLGPPGDRHETSAGNEDQHKDTRYQPSDSHVGTS